MYVRAHTHTDTNAHRHQHRLHTCSGEMASSRRWRRALSSSAFFVSTPARDTCACMVCA